MATGRVPTTANSPLTAKGDLFTYDTSQARLAVGNNGETLVADSSQSTGLRWGNNYGFTAGKNKIINGDFNINQRAFSSTTTNFTYGFDRFRLDTGNGGTATYSAQTFTPGTAPVAGYEAKNYARIVTASMSANNSYAILFQPIEDVRTCAGLTVTVSFWAKAASGTPKIGVELYQEFGSGGSATANQVGQAVTISTSWTRYSVQVALPSLSGKTIGTNNGVYLGLWVNAGSTFDTRSGSIGIQNNTFDIWGVQVEAGSVATAFQTATGTLAGELAACQRYYWKLVQGANAYIPFSTGYNFQTTQLTSVIQLPVEMRVVPTLDVLGGTDFFLFSRAGANDFFNGFTSEGSTTKVVAITSTSNISGTAGDAGGIYVNNNNSTAYVAWSAEL